MNEKKITFRMAKEKDAGLVMSFIRQLSVYEAVSYTHLTLPTNSRV